MITVSAPGSNDEDFKKDDIDLGMLADASPKVTALGKLRIDASRASGEPAEIADAGPGTMVELVLEGGLRWITTVKDLEESFPDRARRSATDGSDGFRLPTHLGRAVLRGGDRDGLKINEASFFDVDIDQLVKEFTGDPAAKAGEIAGHVLGSKMAEWFDKKLVENPGLYRVETVGNAAKLGEQTIEEPLPADSEPYLLFLHGTASTTDGSFGGFWEKHPNIWSRINEFYEGRMLAFEHHTLAESPIRNALTVAEKLPENATLHIVSHSRGGMIGELLCRSGRIFDTPFSGPSDSLFDETDFGFLEAEGYAMLKENLKNLDKILCEKKITVERFVRVACPAAGTTLADGKLDRWLSTLMNVVGKIGGDTSAIYRFIRGFTLAVVETRSEPEHIPGLEAMMPGSALTRILNRPDIRTSADLSAIAGDIDGKGVFQRLGVWLTDLYYQGDHDLVVDTASMYGGQRRPSGKARSFFDEGPEVYHFQYFKNEKTADKVWDGLRRKDPKDGEETETLGFLPLPSPPELKDLQSRSGEPRPSVFILPGILGSELSYAKDGKDDVIWLDLKDVFRGRLERLDLHRANKKKIRPFQMFPRYYNDLANFLAASHDVLPFAYDWRITMKEEADRFAGELVTQLDGNTQPVRILAHSMGGLVARLAFARHADLWQKFKAKEGSRLVMLGTPNLGSFSNPRMLMGKEKTTGLLALLDIRNSEKDLLNMIRRFPGILELLPVGSHHDFFDEKVWKALDEAEGKGWQEPVNADLDIARETWRLLENAPIDNTNMVYVAGKAESTPVDLAIDGSKVRFKATARGDGRVPWATGIPKGLPTFYVAAEHGDLPRHQHAFGGYLDLLQQGTTRLISNTAPVDRGASMPFELPDDPTPIYPDAQALEAAALGSKARYLTSGVKIKPVTIQVRHGDLSFSPFPVMLGHYEQDSLVGAERALDASLDGRLSKRYRRGLYPGRIDTTEVILDDKAFPTGAVVIGLGAVGSLTVGKLKRALLHGLRRYCLAEEEQRAQKACLAGNDQSPVSEPAVSQRGAAGLSTLIIGSGDGGMGIKGALTALLDAVLELQREEGLGNLDHIDIIELSEHRAISAMRELEKLHKNPVYGGPLDINLDLQQSEGGVRKLVLDADQDWSRRIEIKEMETQDKRYHGLHYAVLTGRARIEDSVVADTLKLADAFIAAAIDQASYTGHASPGRTLFELLLPNRLKLASDDDRDLVLMLDRFAANYPWELLEDTSDDTVAPPAVRAGLIRQLHDDRFRQQVLTTNQHTALVVGDPEPVRPNKKFLALDGAVKEARTVAHLIGRSGYAVDEEIRTRPTAAISALMSGAYRILHLAGHGVFEEPTDDNDDDPKTDDNGKPVMTCVQTGMVLGDGLFLTVGAVNQLSHVPELVFLNCCHLGNINARAEKKAATRLHELAANLATQFIRIGCKAVIAAGWAVDDEAANTFATTFYRAMLDDHAKFMDAVKQARKQTFMSHPNTNTWGAYQAYGDPAFTLNGRKTDGRQKPAAWYHPYEAELAFKELAQHAQAAARTDLGHLKRTFDQHWTETRLAWRNQSDILAAKARAAGELGLFAEAIKAYDLAITAEKSEAPINAIEQRANLRARYAVHLAKGKMKRDDVILAEPLDMIIASLEELKKLMTLRKQDEPADTVDLEALDQKDSKAAEKVKRKENIERLNLFGSAAKRASQLYVKAEQTAADILRETNSALAEKTYFEPDPRRKDYPDEQIEWLKDAAGCYKKAHDQAPLRGYALTNWLSMAALIALRGGKLDDKDVQPPSSSDQEMLLADAAGAEQVADRERPDFWALTSKGDMALTRLLIHAAAQLLKSGNKRAAKAHKENFEALVSAREEAVVKAYVKAWKRGGSVLKMNSVMEQLDFVMDALAIGSSTTSFERQRLIKAIKHIENTINDAITPEG